MTYSCSFNNYTPCCQHRKRTNESEAWLNRKFSDNSNLTTFSSGSSQEFIANKSANSKANSSSNTEVNNSFEAAVISNSIEQPNSLIKTQETKRKDQFNQDSYLNAATGWNKSKTSSSKIMCISQRIHDSSSPLTKIKDIQKENTDAKSTSKTIDSNESNKQEKNITDASKVENETQQFIARRRIKQPTLLKEAISKTLKNITMNIDSATNIDRLFFPNEDYNKLKIYIEEIKKHKKSFYFEFLNEEEIQICNNFYDSDYTTRKQIYFNNSKIQNIIMKIFNKYSCYY
ncbi:hypothetical protein O181_075672 [Austropuccinia psidii MF-1]|uniref:Uncharacterized protein n=1 Tax=Austropuccinia psidii MF-1 TaxID=1389203 RepID=A0A9Q3FD14_9BASI|nr:hypothetical protein [Austropuccinia psidii MF-1]